MKLTLDLTPQEIADAHELLAEGALNRRSFAAIEGMRTKEESLRLNSSSQSIRHKLAQAEAVGRDLAGAVCNRDLEI